MTHLTATVQADDVMMDFSVGRKSIKFKVDDDIFEAVPDIATELVMEYAAKLEELGSTDPENVSLDYAKESIYSTLRLVLFPESADRFIARLSDQQNPIGQQRLNKITTWLLEEYGLRPTGQDSASSTGSESQDAGTN